MRLKRSFFARRLALVCSTLMLCLGIAIFALVKLNIFAEPLGDDVRVNEDEDLIYYITVNSDGIDYESTTSSDTQIANEASGITKVTNRIPDGLTFVDFVTSSDGTFGAVQRDDHTTACAGTVIDDTNEEGVNSGVWNDETNEYTYHGLHYDANTNKISFRTKGITAGCELTVGFITHTPTLAENELRRDFYDHANFVDESLTGSSNEVHAYIQKDGSAIPGEYTLSYRYDGVIPEDAPALPVTTYYETSNANITVADAPYLEGYSFSGWVWDPPNSTAKGISAANLTTLPNGSVELYGEFSPTSPVPDGDGDYSLRYRYNGVVPDTAPKLPAGQRYNEGDAITMADTPEIDCYDFEGWYWTPKGSPSSVVYTDPMTTLSGKMPNQDVIFFGKFTLTCDEPPVYDPVNYTVSYEVEGEKPESFNVPSSRSYLEGAYVELDPTAENENIDGFSFSGWSTDDVEVENSLYFEMPSRNVTLLGSFNQESYEVSYQFMGDLPENAESLLPATASYHAGETVTVASDVSAEGYTFLGWQADPSFEMPSENVTIYGEWQKNKETFEPKISVTIKDQKDIYYKGDEVVFETTVTNDMDFDIVNVWVEELLDGACFEASDAYTVNECAFAKVDAIPAGESVVLVSVYTVEKNAKKTYLNEVEIIAAESSDPNYALPGEWNNKGSAEFNAGIIEGLPVDKEDEPSTPVTRDGIIKAISSGSVMSLGLFLAIVLVKRNRRGGVAGLAMPAVVIAASGLTVSLINGGGIFADSLEEKPIVTISSRNANFDNEEAGAWKVTESAEWTGVGEATLSIDLATKRISDLHDKDVILVLDNSVWTRAALNGTEVDNDSDPTTLSLMKAGATEFVEDLLESGDSRVMVLKTWGDDEYEFSDNAQEVTSKINAITSVSNTNNKAYNETYNKLIGLADSYSFDESRSLNVIYVSDDHFAFGDDIALYRLLKRKLPEGSVISGIGFGLMETLGERYVSGSSASENGVARYWIGVDGNLRPIGSYTVAVSGLDQISDYHEDPYQPEFVAALRRAADSSSIYDKFNLSTEINLADFDIKGIYGDVGDIEISEGNISWKNEDEPLVSGARYSMGIVLQAKDSTVQKHKLYKLNNSTSIETAARDIASENVTSNESVVLMNGYEVTFNINNSSTCNLGNNQSGIYFALQRINLDESGVSCDGWNFDNFKDPETGDIFTSRINSMPAYDVELMATWRKTDVEVHMDGRVHQVAPAVLKAGLDFNASLYNIMKNPYSNILLKADGCPSNIMDSSHMISVDDSETTPVYAYVVPDNSFEYLDPNTGEDGYYYSNVTYYCTDANEIYLNEDSSGMFAGMRYDSVDSDHPTVRSNVTIIDEDVKNWNASNVKDMNHMFYSSPMGLKTIGDMGDWNTSSVENMDSVFEDTGVSATNITKNENAASWDTSKVTSAKRAFAYTTGILDYYGGLADWDVSNVVDFTGMFSRAKFDDSSVLSEWDVSSAETMEDIFYSIGSPSYAVPSDLSGIASWGNKLGKLTSLKGAFEDANIKSSSVFASWNVENVTDMNNVFNGVKIDADSGKTMSGISNWTVTNVTDMSGAFKEANIVNLEMLSAWRPTSVTNLNSTFSSIPGLTSLDGLEEWNTNPESSALETMSDTFSNNPDLTDLGALSDWNVSKVTNMSSTFANISADNLYALSDWNVASVVNMKCIFAGGKYIYTVNNHAFSNLGCDSIGDYREPFGGVKSLAGVENWHTDSLENMNGLVMGSALSDLSSISGWNIDKVKDIRYITTHTNIASLEPMLGWTMDNLEYLSFARSKKLTSLHGIENWNVKKVANMDFSYMDSLADISALLDWETDSLTYFSFRDHRNLTSLHGLENWDVSKVTSMYYSFKGYSTQEPKMYTDWSQYCDNKLADISALSGWTTSSLQRGEYLFACDSKVTSLEPLSTWDVKDIYNFESFFEGMSGVTSLDGLESWGSETTSLVALHYPKMFMNMTGLTDVSAVAEWRLAATNISSMFRNDNKVTNFSTLNDSPIQNANYKDNAFDGVAVNKRPSWAR